MKNMKKSKDYVVIGKPKNNEMVLIPQIQYDKIINKKFKVGDIITVDIYDNVYIKILEDARIIKINSCSYCIKVEDWVYNKIINNSDSNEVCSNYILTIK